MPASWYGQPITPLQIKRKKSMMSKNTDTFSTSMNRVLAQSQCYCWFRVGLTGEPSKKRFAFPLARESPQSQVLRH